MDEILNVYKNIVDGIAIDSSVYNYENINVVLDGKSIHVFDSSGKTPVGKYKFPQSEDQLKTFLEKMNAKVTELEDNNQYLCSRCGNTFDLPEFKRDRFGSPACETCAGGGDIREKKPVVKDDPMMERQPQDAEGRSPIIKVEMSEEDAIKFLHQKGYVVKKLAKSYKVVYIDDKGESKVSVDYYRSKEDFASQNIGEFVSLVKELNKSEEEKL